MSKIYVVGVDGSNSSDRAAGYAAEHAMKSGAEVKLIHVLQWSPYTFLTPEELEERHKRRAEELERAQSALVDPVLNKINNDDLSVEGLVRYGEIAEVIQQYSDEIGASHIFVGRHGDVGLVSRIFGSVPGALVQISDVPVTVVP